MIAPLQLLEALDLPGDTTEGDLSLTLLAALTSATQDEEPRLSLGEISQLINKFDVAHLLSPLDALAVLLGSKDPISKGIIRALSQIGPAKEVIMAVQEALERLDAHANNDDSQIASSEDQLIALIEAYALAIPRLTLRRKSASETLRPLISDLEKVIQAHGDVFSISQGRSVILQTSILVQEVHSWVCSAAAAAESSDERSSCNGLLNKVVLMNVLSGSLVACAHCIQSSAAKRAFATHYSRLVVDGSLSESWEEGERVIQQAIQAANAIGFSPNSFVSQPSIGHIVLLAHASFQPLSLGSGTLEKLLTAILAAFQSNAALDECLALLLNFLPNIKESVISPEVITPLCTILSSVASAHQDPSVRHQCFRVLSLLLSHSPPMLRLEALKELTTDSHLPQMRTAAVGLVKEAVLEGLASSSYHIFASRIFVQVFAPILFRPNPPDFFSREFSPEDMSESYEASRTIECLSLYYVLIQRDEGNKTGIRDHDVINNIEKTFLAPLRLALSGWTNKDAQNVPMPLISLQISIDRVDGAINGLN